MNPSAAGAAGVLEPGVVPPVRVRAVNAVSAQTFVS